MEVACPLECSSGAECERGDELGRRVREELEQSEDAREGSDDGDIDMLALAELRAQHDGDGGAQHGESGKGDIESLDNRHGLCVWQQVQHLVLEGGHIEGLVEVCEGHERQHEYRVGPQEELP